MKVTPLFHFSIFLGFLFRSTFIYDDNDTSLVCFFYNYVFIFLWIFKACFVFVKGYFLLFFLLGWYSKISRKMCLVHYCCFCLGRIWSFFTRESSVSLIFEFFYYIIIIIHGISIIVGYLMLNLLYTYILNFFFLSYVWKHVRYHVLISRHPGVITQL